MALSKVEMTNEILTRLKVLNPEIKDSVEDHLREQWEAISEGIIAHFEASAVVQVQNVEPGNQTVTGTIT